MEKQSCCFFRSSALAPTAYAAGSDMGTDFDGMVKMNIYFGSVDNSWDIAIRSDEKIVIVRTECLIHAILRNSSPRFMQAKR